MLNFKNPFLYIALILVIIFFIPMHSAYIPLKIVVAIMVISYGINVKFFKKVSHSEEQKKYTKKSIEELEEALDKMENK